MTTSLDIARGLDSTLRVVRVFGRCAAIDSGGARDLWSGRDLGSPVNQAVLPSAAGVLTLVSTSASDVLGGGGCATVRVTFLDADFAEDEEVVTLNGATPVNTVAEIRRVLDMRVASGAVNVGDVSASAGADLQAVILAGQGRASHCRYTVPADHRAYVRRVQFTGSAAVIAQLLSRPAWLADNAYIVEADPQVTALALDESHAPLVFDAKTDLLVRAQAVSTTARATAELSLVLEAY